MSSVQLLNYVLPLITMPYLVTHMGVAGYGLIGFGQSVMMYFLLVVDYGFNINGTRAISLQRNKKEEVNRIYSEIMASKLFLVFVCFIILILMILFIPKMRMHPSFYLIFYGIVLGNAFFPVFLFQGLEEMTSVGILNFVSKMIFTVGLFIFVKTPNDFDIVAILNSLGYLVMGVIAQLIVRFKYRLKISKVVFRDIKYWLRDGFHLFIANIASTSYTTTNMFFLGLMKGNTAAGYFNLAYTLIRVCGSVASPIIQTFYPKISIAYSQSKDQAMQNIKKLGKYMTITFFVGCLILLGASGFILSFIFGSKFNHSFLLIQIMSFMPLLIVWENIMGTVVMTIAGHQRELSKIYSTVAVISLLILFVLTYFFSEVGTAVSAALAELLVVIQMYAYLKRRGIFFKKKME